MAGGLTMETVATNDEIAALILPWAKERHPDKYAQTLKTVAIPATFRRYLIRLVEIRWAEEPEWRGSVPLSVLEESAIVCWVARKDGKAKIEVRGVLAKPRTVGFAMLATPPEEFENLMELIAAFDAEIVDG